MVGEHLRGVSKCGEVVGLIPFLQKTQVGTQALHLKGIDGKTQLQEATLDFLLDGHGFRIEKGVKSGTSTRLRLEDGTSGSRLSRGATRRHQVRLFGQWVPMLFQVNQQQRNGRRRHA